MGRLNLIQTNMTAGELSPRMFGRVDVARYANGVALMENAYPVIHGGGKRRSGGRFVTFAKFDSKRARLIPYVYSQTEAYILEFGEGYFRVYKNSAQLTHPTNAITGITQANPAVVTSNAHGYANGDAVYITGVSGMVEVNGLRYIVANVTANTFELAGVNSTGFTAYVSGGTVAKIYEVVSPYTEAQLSDIDYVQGADTMFTFHQSVAINRVRRYGDLTWTMDTTRFVAEPFDVIGLNPPDTLTLASTAVGVGVNATSTGNSFLAADVGRELVFQSGVARITAELTNSCTLTITTAFPQAVLAPGTWYITGNPNTTCTPSAVGPVGATITLTLPAAGWRPTDVGKFVRINNGLVRIDLYTSNIVVSGTVLQVLSATVGAPALAWTLEQSVWGGIYGYPRTGTLFEQRLWAAGSPGFPQTVWGSVIGEYLNFELGTLDDDGCSFTISSDQINPIEHLTQVKTLIALTYGGEFTLEGGVEKPITPTNVQIKQQSSFGCNNVLPERIGNELLFTHRAGRKIRAMAAGSFDSGNYGAPDVTVLAEHITLGGITDMSYQQEPDSLLQCIRTDGVMPTLTIDRDQEVTGWARQTTDGEYESIATIPTASGEQTWYIAKRVINGVTKRCVEYFDSALHTDAAITGTSGPGATVWRGLNHLEGKTVRVKGDGIVMQSRVVAGGMITTERDVHDIEIGLNYNTTIVTLTPEVAGQSGSAQGEQMRINEVVLRVLESTGAWVNDVFLPFRRINNDALDAPLVPYTGDVRCSKIGWGKGVAQLTIEQRDPLPLHVLAVIKTISVNEG